MDYNRSKESDNSYPGKPVTSVDGIVPQTRESAPRSIERITVVPAHHRSVVSDETGSIMLKESSNLGIASPPSVTPVAPGTAIVPEVSGAMPTSITNPSELAPASYRSIDEIHSQLREAGSEESLEVKDETVMIPEGQQSGVIHGSPNTFLAHQGRKRILSVATGVIASILLLSGLFIFNNTRSDKETGPVRVITSISSIDLIKVMDDNIGGLGQVQINGPLKVQNSFTVSPSTQPQIGTAGQLYFDQNSNSFSYYDGSKFQLLANTESVDNAIGGLGGLSTAGAGAGLALNGNLLSNSGVLSLQGQTGDLSFLAGNGIAVNGLQITNTGVTAVQGTANQVVVSQVGGVVTLALPQAISTLSSPNFAGLTLASALSVASGGTGSSSFNNNGAVYYNGSSLVSTATPSNGDCLVVVAGVPSFIPCPGGGGGISSLDGQTGPVITINNASGAANVITIDDATTGAKGIASFTSGHFSVSSGAVSLNVQANKGIEVDGNGLSLVDCVTDGHILKYSTGTSQWACAADGVGGTGDILNNGQNGTVRVGSNNGNSTILESNNVDRLTIDSTGAATFSGTLVTSGLLTANAGATIAAGQTFNIGGDNLDELVGTGLQIASGDLQTTLGTSVDLTSEITGTLAIGSGGTGVTSAATDGQLLIGNGSGYTLATLTAGSGVSINNAAGSITISAPSAGSCAGCANTALSNLASVDINSPLVSDAGDLTLQTTTSGNIIMNSIGTIEIQDNTNVTGTLVATGQINSNTGIYTGAVAGTQRIDASGNLQNIGDINIAGASTSIRSGGTEFFRFTPGGVNSTFSCGQTLTNDCYIQAGSNLFLSGTSAGAVGINTGASSTGAVTLGNNTGNTPINLDSGTATISIGTGAFAHTTNIATGAAAQTVNIGSLTSTSTLNLQGGTGGINLGTGGIANTIQIGNTTGAVSQTINIGNNSTASSTNNVNIGSSIAGTTAITGLTTVTNRTSGSSDTFNVSNSTSTGTIAKFNDNATTVFSLADGGAALFQNQTDSTTAFQIQNAAGTSLLNADTSNSIVRPGVTAATSTVSLTTTEMTNSDSVGTSSSVAVGVDGLPVIAYYNLTDTDINVTKCSNASCSSSTTFELTNGDDVGQFGSITIGTDGLPVIAYNNTTDGDINVTKCGNASCSSGNTTTEISNGDDVGTFNSITIGTDGFPVISYLNSTDSQLNVTKCGNASCSSGNTTTEVSDSDATGRNTSITISTDGYPAISHYNATADQVSVTKCSTVSCSSSSTTDISSAGITSNETSIAIGTDGLPIISHINPSNLRIIKCGNASCSTSTITELSTSDSDGGDSSLAIGTDGLAVISYRNATDGDINVVKCTNIICSTSTTTEISNGDSVGADTYIALGADGLPVISYHNTTDNDLNVTKCADSACANASGDTYSGGITLGTVSSAFQSVYFDTLNLGKEGAKVSLDQNGTFIANGLTTKSDGTASLNLSDSTTAFQIQNAMGTKLFSTDTINGINTLSGTHTTIQQNVTGVSSTLLSDNFDRAPLGINWTNRAGTFDINSNKARMTASNGGGIADVTHYNALSPTDADYTVQADVNFNGMSQASANYACVMGRRVNEGSIDSFGYLTCIDNNSGQLRMYKRATGPGYTELGTPYTIPSYSNSTTYTIRLGMDGTSLTSYLDGVSRVTATDSTYTAAGDFAISAGTGNGGTGQTWDNFQVTSATVTSVLQVMNNGGSSLQTTDSSGRTTFKSSTNSTSAFQIQNATGEAIFNIDTVNGGSVAFRNSADSTMAFQIQNASGTTIIGLDTTNSRIFSNISDGASAVGFKLNVANSYSTTGAKLLSVQNATVEKFFVDWQGNVGIISGQAVAFQGIGNTENVVTKRFTCTVAVSAGDAVIIDTANAGQVTTTTTADSNLIAGVARSAAGAGATCEIAISGVIQVKSDTTAIGDLLTTDNVAGQVDNGTAAVGNVLGKALSTDAAGKAWILLTHN